MSGDPDPPDEFSKDEDPTKQVCPACGGDARRECTLCHGEGFVTADQAAKWHFEKAARIARRPSGARRLSLSEPPEDKDKK